MKTVHRRTFEALKHPKGSPERERLNCDELTSEYMPSYRYVVMDDGIREASFRTKKEANIFAGKQ